MQRDRNAGHGLRSQPLATIRRARTLPTCNSSREAGLSPSSAVRACVRACAHESRDSASAEHHCVITAPVCPRLTPYYHPLLTGPSLLLHSRQPFASFLLLCFTPVFWSPVDQIKGLELEPDRRIQRCQPGRENPAAAAPFPQRSSS